jgi:soluble lytic murein transglycosylase
MNQARPLYPLWFFLGLLFLLSLTPVWPILAQDSLSFAPDEQVPDANGLGAGEERPDRLQGDPENQLPYWLAPDGRTSPEVPGQKEDAPGLFAPPPPPPAAPPAQAAVTGIQAEPDEEDIGEVMSYYMFKDDQGVTHLTDAPVDPRYRLFTIQITVTTGRAPFRRLNIERLRPFILQASTTYKVDPALITAIIKAESAFDPKAVSWAGAQGLMQLMPNTARLMGVTDSFDPEQNIMGGTRYIRMMLNRFDGDVTLAVAAYNCGPERVARAKAVPRIRETLNYVKTVLRNYEMFLRVFNEPEL